MGGFNESFVTKMNMQTLCGETICYNFGDDSLFTWQTPEEEVDQKTHKKVEEALWVNMNDVNRKIPTGSNVNRIGVRFEEDKYVFEQSITASPDSQQTVFHLTLPDFYYFVDIDNRANPESAELLRHAKPFQSVSWPYKQAKTLMMKVKFKGPTTNDRMKSEIKVWGLRTVIHFGRRWYI
jgi:hypothetical protein